METGELGTWLSANKFDPNLLFPEDVSLLPPVGLVEVATTL